MGSSSVNNAIVYFHYILGKPVATLADQNSALYYIPKLQ
jgi:hypothetical protein